MNDCLFELRLKGLKKKVKIFGFFYDNNFKNEKVLYYVCWDRGNDMFIYLEDKNFEPITNNECEEC